jgi:hypothetical protein
MWWIGTGISVTRGPEREGSRVGENESMRVRGYESMRGKQGNDSGIRDIRRVKRRRDSRQ